MERTVVNEGSHINHVAGGHAQGGKTCLHTHSGGAKALFSYKNLQVTGYDGGGGKYNAKSFIC